MDCTCMVGTISFFIHAELPPNSIVNEAAMMNNVKVRLVKSTDSFYHAYAVKISSGSNPDKAETLANRVNFSLSQNDVFKHNFPKVGSILFENNSIRLIVCSMAQLASQVYEWPMLRLRRVRTGRLWLRSRGLVVKQSSAGIVLDVSAGMCSGALEGEA